MGKELPPLRRVLEIRAVHIPGSYGLTVPVPKLALECGHLVTRAHDFTGHGYPARRRCRKCQQGLPADFALSPAPEASHEQA